MKNKMINNANIIIYDDENIKYYQGVLITMDCETIIDNGIYLNGETYTNIMGYNVNFTISNLEEYDNIKLDDTTMKRIAKYNKEQECLKLDNEIEKKQEKIKELDNLLKDKEKRWQKVKDYIANIYEIEMYDNDCDDYDYFED